MKPTLQEAISLLEEHVKSPSLRKHCRSVGYSMRAYAQSLSLSQSECEKWEISGVLHDFDFEKFPNLEQHPFEGVKILRSLSFPEDIIEAILGHAEHTGVPRKTQMAKTLFAVDELSGFIVALAHVRPENFEGISPKSVKKALKKSGFAQKVNRSEIQQGIDELSLDKDAHFSLVIKALSEKAMELGF